MVGIAQQCAPFLATQANLVNRGIESWFADDGKYLAVFWIHDDPGAVFSTEGIDCGFLKFGIDRQNDVITWYSRNFR